MLELWIGTFSIESECSNINNRVIIGINHRLNIVRPTHSIKILLVFQSKECHNPPTIPKSP